MSKERLHLVKVGGKLINQPDMLERFLVAFSGLKGHKLLVHGGGRKATEISEKLNIVPHIIQGRRITDENTLEVVVMVYAGLINKRIVALLQGMDINASGFTGADGDIIRSHQRKIKEINYGFVGDIDFINDLLIKDLVLNGLVPVIAPITHDGMGQLLNTNADTIAAELAIGLQTHFEVNLSYCFEYNGVMANPDKSSTETFHRLRKSQYLELLENKQIHSGMIPKLANCFNAVEKGVHSVHICGIDNLTCHTDATKISSE